MQVFAYELLYRDTDGKLAEIKNNDQASSQVILNALSDIGLERLVGDSKAFFNLTRNLFMDEVPLAPGCFQSGIRDTRNDRGG